MKKTIDEIADAVSIESVANEITERKIPKANFEHIEPTPIINEPVGIDKTKSFETEFFNETTEDIENDLSPKSNSSGISDKEAKESGETGAYLIGGGIETVFSLIERFVFISKFSKKEKERLVKIEDINDSDKTSEDISLEKKFLRLSNKHDKIRANIPLSDIEHRNIANGLEEYAKITGKTFSPELLLWVTIIKAISDKTIDIFL